ncbi:phosphatase RsbU N-terminal domain-containing protein [Geodermatophilus amargosae]|uniref:phosphatase RsbU N-terminal domain-containing protein n=1 Tax=Geodermatophilus amargosae TaxID=1296565 RepID=UPI0034E024A6
MTTIADLHRDHRAALLRHLGRREESALEAGYQLGRAALAADISLLEVVRVHHDVLLEVLRDTPADEVPAVAQAASDFLLELVASYDMSQRRSPGGRGRPA